MVLKDLVYQGEEIVAQKALLDFPPSPKEISTKEATLRRDCEKEALADPSLRVPRSTILAKLVVQTHQE